MNTVSRVILASLIGLTPSIWASDRHAPPSFSVSSVLHEKVKVTVIGRDIREAVDSLLEALKPRFREVTRENFVFQGKNHEAGDPQGDRIELKLRDIDVTLYEVLRAMADAYCQSLAIDPLSSSIVYTAASPPPPDSYATLLRRFYLSQLVRTGLRMPANAKREDVYKALIPFGIVTTGIDIEGDYVTVRAQRAEMVFIEALFLTLNMTGHVTNTEQAPSPTNG